MSDYLNNQRVPTRPLSYEFRSLAMDKEFLIDYNTGKMYIATTDDSGSRVFIDMDDVIKNMIGDDVLPQVESMVSESLQNIDPDVIHVPTIDEEGNVIKDEDGNPVMVEFSTALAEIYAMMAKLYEFSNGAYLRDEDGNYILDEDGNRIKDPSVISLEDIKALIEEANLENINKIINGDKTLDPSDPGYNGIADKIDQVYEDFYPEAQEGEDPLPSIKEQIEALQAMVDTINEIVQGDTEDPTSKTLEQRLNELEALINPASGEGTLTTEVEAATEALESIGTVLTVNDSTGKATLDNTTLGPNSVVPASVVTESDTRKFVTAAQLALINTIGSRTKMCTVQVTVPLSSWSENTSNKHFYKTIQVQSGSIKIPTTTSPIMDLVTTANYNTAQKQEEVYSYIFKATVSSLGNVTLYASKDPSTVTSDISSITIQFQFWYTDSDTVS